MVASSRFNFRYLSIALSITALVAYGFLAHAATTPPVGGYAPGAQLEPDCDPESTDCTVRQPWLLNTSDDFVYTTTSSIGIGTDTPTATLDVTGDFVVHGSDASASTSASKIINGSGATLLNIYNNGNLVIGDDDFAHGSGEEAKMFFDRTNFAFRAGGVRSTEWDAENVGQRSIALGFSYEGGSVDGPVASGFLSIAIGANAQATGLASLALGNSTLASGLNSVALLNGQATGSSSFAWRGTASNSSAVAFGQNVTASGLQSYAIGTNTTASGTQALALGTSVTSSGNNSVAIGQSASASGVQSVVLGSSATATGDRSVGLGYGANAYSAQEVVVGGFPTVYTPASATGWDINDRLFVVGGGTSAGFESDALTILKNGQVGIALDHFENQTNGSPLQVGDGGLNRIGYVDGVTGDWVAVSDRRAKKNISEINYGLNEILNLEPVQYDFRRNNEHAIGFIAQDVKEVIPEIVSGSDAEGYGVAYQKLTPVLVKAIQELDVKINHIETIATEQNVSLMDTLAAFLANAANGITRIFTGEICLTEPGYEPECITRADLVRMKAASEPEMTSSGPTHSGEVTPDPGSESTPEGGDTDTNSEVVPQDTITPDSTANPGDAPQDANTSDSTANPASEPAAGGSVPVSD